MEGNKGNRDRRRNGSRGAKVGPEERKIKKVEEATEDMIIEGKKKIVTNEKGEAWLEEENRKEDERVKSYKRRRKGEERRKKGTEEGMEMVRRRMKGEEDAV